MGKTKVMLIIDQFEQWLEAHPNAEIDITWEIRE